MCEGLIRPLLPPTQHYNHDLDHASLDLSPLTPPLPLFRAIAGYIRPSSFTSRRYDGNVRQALKLFCFRL